MNDTHICHFVYNPHSLFIGRFYFEATVTDEGLCRVGWSTQQASLELGNHSYQSSQWLYLLVGKDRFGFGFGGTGKKSWNNQFDTYGEVSNWYTVSNSLSLSLSLSLCLSLKSFGKDDTIGCYIDLQENQISYNKNGMY